MRQRSLFMTSFLFVAFMMVSLHSMGRVIAQGPQQAASAPRPQEPKPPFPYRSLEVRYANPSAPGVTLAATLTLPEGRGKFPAAIFIGGSGQFPRDQPFFGHKMPLVLADYLTRRGIAVLRFDDRGAGQSTLGAKKTGDLSTDDFVSDARAGIAYLLARPEIDHRRIGIIGHSEGTQIAGTIAAESPGETSFVVLLAAASASMTKGEIVAAQSETMARLSGLSEEARKADREFMRRALAVMRQESEGGKRLRAISAIADEALAKMPEGERAAVEPGIRKRVKILASENFYQDAVSRRRDYLREVRCPVLALNGGKDVLISAAENVPRLRASLSEGGNKDFTVKILPDLNHMFQTAKTGLMEEAGEIEETFAPFALRLIGDWVIERVGKE